MKYFSVSMFVARYGSEENFPMYNPVIPKWDGKESLAAAHAKANDVNNLNTVDIEGLEVI